MHTRQYILHTLKKPAQRSVTTQQYTPWRPLIEDVMATVHTVYLHTPGIATGAVAAAGDLLLFTKFLLRFLQVHIPFIRILFHVVQFLP